MLFNVLVINYIEDFGCGEYKSGCVVSVKYIIGFEGSINKGKECKIYC